MSDSIKLPPIPEPVAWMTNDGRAATQETRDSAMATPSRLAFSVALITTTQAEAYKDACVRKALEEAADTCAWLAIPTSHDAPDKQAARECALAIRALIDREGS